MNPENGYFVPEVATVVETFDVESNTRSITFAVEGPPRVKKRHRRGARGQFFNPSSRTEQQFKASLNQLLINSGLTAPVFQDSRNGLVMSVDFELVRPARHYRRNQRGNDLRPSALGNTSCRGDLSNLMKFVEDSMNPQIVIRGYKRALEICLRKLDDLVIQIDDTPEKKRNMLLKCAETALNSKLLASYKSFFAEITL